MAIVANTFTSFDAAGIRESLADVIANISPEEVPLQSNIGSENVSNTYFEWQTDSLASTSTTARIDGDDVTSYDSTSSTTRVGNYTHILRRTLIVADNMGAQDLAGRNDEPRQAVQLMVPHQLVTAQTLVLTALLTVRRPLQRQC